MKPDSRRHLNSPSRRLIISHRIRVTVLLILALSTFVLLHPANFLPAQASLNIDDQIPIAVSQVMATRERLDPDWHGADLVWLNENLRYQFYGYSVLSHVWLQFYEAPSVGALRDLNVALQALAILVVFCSVYISLNLPNAIFAAAALLVNPSVSLDAMQARPESLVYLLTACLLASSLLFGRRPVGSTVFSGVIIGSSIATKFSLAPLAVLPALLIVVHPVGKKMRLFMSLTFAIIAGFSVTAPYILINPEVFISTIKAVFHLYDSHPPYSGEQHTFASQLADISSFIALAYPLLMCGLGVAVWALHSSSRIPNVPCRDRLFSNIGAATGILIALYILYFATKPVFFERNFAQLHVLAAFSCALFLYRSVQSKFGLLLASGAPLLLMGYWNLCLHMSISDLSKEADRHYAPSLQISFADVFSQRVPSCGVLKVVNYGDDYFDLYAQELAASGFKEIGEYRSPFHILPVSTLQTYVQPSYGYFKKNCPD